MELVLVWYGRLGAEPAQGLQPPFTYKFIYKYMNKTIVTVHENVSTRPSPYIAPTITMAGPIAIDI